MAKSRSKGIAALRSTRPAEEVSARCPCERCVRERFVPTEARPFWQDRMILCASCRNKRCPHATDHNNTCTGSNEAGQPGSSYGGLPQGDAHVSK